MAIVMLMLAAAVCSACDDELADTGETPTELCSTNEDCLGDLSCQFGICADEPGVRYSIGLSITPPDFRPELAAQQVTGVPVTLGSALPPYVLSRPVQLSGIVAYDSDDAPPVRADVRFRATNGVPGETFATNVHTAPDGRVFSATLPSGTYDVTIIDDRPDVARVVRRGVNIGVDGTAFGSCPTEDPCQSTVFIVPAPERYVRVDGTLTRRTPRVEPIAGARLFARTTDDRYTSTPATTDEDGAFSLLVPPVDGPWQVHTESYDGAPVPSGAFAPFTISDDLAEVEVALSLGELGDPVLAEGQIDNTGARPLVVIARLEVPPADFEPGTLGFEGGAIEIRSIIEDDEDGAFMLSLVPGNWTIAAASVEASAGLAEPYVWTIDAETPPPRAQLSLIAPVFVSGRVFAPDGATPVAGATITARFTGAWGIVSTFWGIENALWTLTTTSDELGTWSLPLTRGSWSTSVSPPDDVGFGPTTILVEVDDTNPPINIALAEAGVVSGRILDETGEPLAGARVTAWWIQDGTSTPLDEAVTRVDGRWRLVLPARLEAPNSLP